MADDVKTDKTAEAARKSALARVNRERAKNDRNAQTDGLLASVYMGNSSVVFASPEVNPQNAMPLAEISETATVTIIPTTNVITPGGAPVMASALPVADSESAVEAALTADPANLGEDANPEEYAFWKEVRESGQTTYDETIFAGELKEDDLVKNESFLKAAKTLYDMENGEGAWDKNAATKMQTFTERSQSPNARIRSRYKTAPDLNQELGKWGLQHISDFDFQAWEAGKTALTIEDKTPEQQIAMLYMMRAVEQKDMSWSGVGRGAWAMATDPVTWGIGIAGFASGFVTLGGGWAAGATALTARAAVVTGASKVAQMAMTSKLSQIVGQRVASAAASKLVQNSVIQHTVTKAVVSRVATRATAKGLAVGAVSGAAEGYATDRYAVFTTEKAAMDALGKDFEYADGRKLSSIVFGGLFGGGLGAGGGMIGGLLKKSTNSTPATSTPPVQPAAIKPETAAPLVNATETAPTAKADAAVTPPRSGGFATGMGDIGGPTGVRMPSPAHAPFDERSFGPQPTHAAGGGGGGGGGSTGSRKGKVTLKRNLPKFDDTTQGSFNQSVADFREAQLKLVTEPPAGGWKEVSRLDALRPHARGAKKARSPRDFHSNLTTAWKDLIQDLEKATGSDFATKKATALSKFETTIQDLHASLAIIEPKLEKDSIRYLSDYTLNPDPVQKLAIYKNLERIRLLSSDTLKNNVNSHADFLAFIVDSKARLNQPTGTGAATSSPLKIQDILHDASFKHSGNKWHEKSLMRDFLHGQHAFSGRGLRQKSMINSGNKENIINEDFVKGLSTTNPTSDGYLNTMMGRFQKYVDTHIENTVLESHEEFMMKLGTNPESLADFLTHTDIYGARIEELLYEFYKRNPKDPDVLNFVVRMQHEAKAYMNNPSGALDGFVDSRFDNNPDGFNQGRRATRKRIAEKMRWLYAYSQFRMDGNPDNWKPFLKNIQSYAVNPFKAPYKVLSYVFDNPTVTKEDGSSVKMNKSYYADAENHSLLTNPFGVWGTKPGAAIHKIARIAWRGTGLDLPRVFAEALPLELLGKWPGLLTTSKTGQTILTTAAPGMIIGGTALSAAGSYSEYTPLTYTGETIKVLGKGLFWPAYALTNLNPVPYAGSFLQGTGKIANTLTGLDVLDAPGRWLANGASYPAYALMNLDNLSFSNNNNDDGSPKDPGPKSGDEKRDDAAIAVLTTLNKDGSLNYSKKEIKRAATLMANDKDLPTISALPDAAILTPYLVEARTQIAEEKKKTDIRSKLIKTLKSSINVVNPAERFSDDNKLNGTKIDGLTEMVNYIDKNGLYPEKRADVEKAIKHFQSLPFHRVNKAVDAVNAYLKKTTDALKVNDKLSVSKGQLIEFLAKKHSTFNDATIQDGIDRIKTAVEKEAARITAEEEAKKEKEETEGGGDETPDKKKANGKAIPIDGAKAASDVLGQAGDFIFDADGDGKSDLSGSFKGVAEGALRKGKDILKHLNGTPGGQTFLVWGSAFLGGAVVLNILKKSFPIIDSIPLLSIVVFGFILGGTSKIAHAGIVGDGEDDGAAQGEKGGGNIPKGKTGFIQKESGNLKERIIIEEDFDLDGDGKPDGTLYATDLNNNDVYAVSLADKDGKTTFATKEFASAAALAGSMKFAPTSVTTTDKARLNDDTKIKFEVVDNVHGTPIETRFTIGDERYDLAIDEILKKDTALKSFELGHQQ